MFSRIGDPDWVLPATIQGVRLLGSTSYHVIFASGSSYFASYIAAAIVSTVFRIPLVLDYGDPWTGEHAGITPRWPRRLDCVLEAQVLRIAREVIVTNERAREGLLDRYPVLRPDQVQVISQGYTAVAPPESASPLNDTGSIFTIAYTGTFYPRLQSPVELLKALRWTCERGLRIRFIHAGQKIADEDARRAREAGVDRFIEYVGDLPHEDAVALQRRATVLLVVGTPIRDEIPGKVIEYIGARRPILCLSAGSDDLAAQFVRRHGLGIVVPDRAVDIQQVLVNLYHWWQEGDLETVAYHPHDVEAFSWQSLARRLQNAFLHHGDSQGSEYGAREIEVSPLGRRG